VVTHLPLVQLVIQLPWLLVRVSSGFGATYNSGLNWTSTLVTSAFTVSAGVGYLLILQQQQSQLHYLLLQHLEVLLVLSIIQAMPQQTILQLILMEIKLKVLQQINYYLIMEKEFYLII
jgi:hypothetical protein